MPYQINDRVVIFDVTDDAVPSKHIGDAVTIIGYGPNFFNPGEYGRDYEIRLDNGKEHLMWEKNIKPCDLLPEFEANVCFIDSLVRGVEQ